MKKNNLKLSDNVKIQNQLITKVINAFFKLPTSELFELYMNIQRELVTREDYCNIDDLKQSYEIIKQELINRGVHNV